MSREEFVEFISRSTIQPIVYFNAANAAPNRTSIQSLLARYTQVSPSDLEAEPEHAGFVLVYR